MRARSYYHKTVRTAALLAALVLVFDSGLLSNDTEVLSDSAVRYLANTVGVMAVVPENEINRLSADIAARDAELDRREREIDARAYDDGNNQSTYVLSAILFLLLVLIMTNYVLDFIRARRIQLVPAKTEGM